MFRSLGSRCLRTPSFFQHTNDMLYQLSGVVVNVFFCFFSFSAYGCRGLFGSKLAKN